MSSTIYESIGYGCSAKAVELSESDAKVALAAAAAMKRVTIVKLKSMLKKGMSMPYRNDGPDLGRTYVREKRTSERADADRDYRTYVDENRINKDMGNGEEAI
jgi:hypothetical protein